jgi:FtsH-binding integral membrane protein
MNEQIASQQVLTAEQLEELQRAFVLKVYSWMAAGLMITGIVSLVTVQTPALLELIFSGRWTFMILLGAQLGIVVWLSARVEKMSAAAATTSFIVYSGLTGLTLSAIFLVYTLESLASTFFVAAGTFGATAAFGYFTKRDLTGVGGFMAMGLIGLVIASVVNIFLNNTTLYWITTYIGVLIFVGLTAYDTQKVKMMAGVSQQGGEVEQKGAIMGALRLYLDFINLFLMLLRLLGNRR